MVFRKQTPDVDDIQVNYEGVYGIFAAPVCSEFSPLNHFLTLKETDEEGGLKLVDACLSIIKKCKPFFWALENPKGALRKYLGKPSLTFQPWWYGDPWTKLTDIWGDFNIPVRQYMRWEDVPNKLDLYTRPGREKPGFNFLHKSAQKDIPQLAGIPAETDADFRAITPPGFAKAFYEANHNW